MNSGANTRHIAAGDLVRLLHGELDGADRETVLAHVEECTRCAERLAETETRFHEVGASLAELEVPALDPARRAQAWAEIQRASLRSRRPARQHGRNRGLRAAAAVAVLVTAAFSADPVRAWVADAWRGLSGVFAGSTASTAPQPKPIRVRNAVVGFVPESAELVLELRSRQEIGSLSLHVTDSVTTASARLIGDDEVEVVVLPGGFRIENVPEHQTDYLVTLPATLKRIAVHVDGLPVLRVEVGDLNLPWNDLIDIATVTASPESTSHTP